MLIATPCVKASVRLYKNTDMTEKTWYRVWTKIVISNEHYAIQRKLRYPTKIVISNGNCDIMWYPTKIVISENAIWMYENLLKRMHSCHSQWGRICRQLCFFNHVVANANNLRSTSNALNAIALTGARAWPDSRRGCRKRRPGLLVQIWSSAFSLFPSFSLLPIPPVFGPFSLFPRENGFR